MKKTIFLLLTMIETYSGFGQTKTTGKLVESDPEFRQLIDITSPIEVIAEGFDWSEGPVWVKSQGFLLFSDVPQNVIYKWKAGEKVVEFLRPSGYTGILPYSNEPGSNGLTLSNDGQLLACEHGDRRVTKMPFSGGGKFAMADNYQGKRFNSPNDLVQSKKGDIYFTDPPYGLPKYDQDPTQEVEGFGVYRISNDRKVSLEIADLTRPNGVALSVDQKTLYVAQSDLAKAWILEYPILENGSLGKGKIFYDATPLAQQGLIGAPDGLKVDEKGNVFSTGPGGVLVINAKGKLLGRIETGQATSNVAWGEDGGTLFITADMYLCRIRTKTKGANF